MFDGVRKAPLMTPWFLKLGKSLVKHSQRNLFENVKILVKPLLYYFFITLRCSYRSLCSGVQQAAPPGQVRVQHPERVGILAG